MRYLSSPIMQLDDFNFPFDSSLIAKYPIRPRDHARLLVLPRTSGECSDHKVIDLPELLEPGDLVVVNDTKVLPVRLVGTKEPGGGKVDILLVKPSEATQWEAFVKGRVRVGQRLLLGEEAQATVVERSRDRTVLKLHVEGSEEQWLNRVGQMPLPPYIKREPNKDDRADYQTMFAKVKGAIAAPTAGLHFTPRLLSALEDRGIKLTTITLHVGPGTFRPVTASNIEDHRMDAEWYHVPQKTADLIVATRKAGKKVVAVGTTVARTLEAAVGAKGQVQSKEDATNLFIRPGFQFQVVDMLLTNFHLPGTTLLMLISAFAGIEQSRAAYEYAVRERYRFYSYGDAMLIK